MKIKLYSGIAALLFCGTLFAQSEKFYATTDAEDAKELQAIFPEQVEILEIRNQHAAVFMTDEAAHYLHKNVITHGPGYVYKISKEAAISSINRPKVANKVLNFTINQDALVNTAINQVNTENIRSHMQTLENYGTRRHTTTQAQTAVQDLRIKWQNLISASGRTDVSVRIVNHTGTAMPSVVLTFNGHTTPAEFVIVGGHLDSISNGSQAPGADDDASGIASITEIIRILLNMNYKPQKTVEFMAYAAEEIGLVGSSEIASQYAADGKNVISAVQFDMTNYKGSPQDIYLTNDSYNSTDLNLFLIELMTHYNASGAHQFTYAYTTCNYGCSDHYSWAENGFPAAFPFESAFGSHNPYIHTTQDKLSNMGNNATHSAKFTKLGLEYIIETAKSSSSAATSETSARKLIFYIKDRAIHYNAASEVQQLQIIEASSRKILEKNQLSASGTVNLDGIKNGFYLAVFKLKNGETVTKKFIVE